MNIIMILAAKMAGIKRKREVLTLKAKQEILDWLECGIKPSSIMQEFNCGKSIISDIKKNKERILGYVSAMEAAGGPKKRKTLKKEFYKDMEKGTYLWFQQECARGTPLFGPSSVRRHFSSIISFMMKTLQKILISRKVKGGLTISSIAMGFDTIFLL